MVLKGSVLPPRPSPGCHTDLEGGPPSHRTSCHSTESSTHLVSALAVTFQRVTFEISRGKGRRQRWQPLLQDVSGYARPLELTAVIGPSGSGKTTLLDLLAGRKTTGRLTADSRILYNNRPPTKALLRRNVGLVEQHDTLLPLLTPAEMLSYTAELKQPRAIPQAQKQCLVQELVARLSLEDCQHTPIGGGLVRGISGGEAKRTNVGISMISRPLLLLCDEPTSGLDSWNAHSVVSALRDLAQDGISVCATIHSPPPHTFALFHRILVLQRGRVVYFGENGNAAYAFFTQHFPHLRARRPGEGISGFIIDVTTSANKQGGEAATAFADAYAASQLRERTESEIKHILAQTAVLQPGGSDAASRGLRHMLHLDGRREQGTVTPWWWGLWVLLRYRAARSYSRPSWVLPRALGPAIPVFLLVTVYWSIGNNLETQYATSIAGIQQGRQPLWATYIMRIQQLWLA